MGSVGGVARGDAAAVRTKWEVLASLTPSDKRFLFFLKKLVLEAAVAPKKRGCVTSPHVSSFFDSAPSSTP